MSCSNETSMDYTSNEDDSCCPPSCTKCQKICVLKADGESLNFLLGTDVRMIKCISEACADVIVVVGPEVPDELAPTFNKHKCVDKGFEKIISLMFDDNLGIPIIYSPLLENTDYHDVRVYHDAAVKAFDRVVLGKFQNPVLIAPRQGFYTHSDLLTILGALQALYVPLQVREDNPNNVKLVDSLWVLVECQEKGVELCREVTTLEPGRFVFRDISMADPERLTPIRTEDYVYELFKDSAVLLEVICDPDYVNKQFPLFEAVNRAAQRAVKRHQGRVLLIEYVPPCTPKRTLMLVGKGVTFDTGGVSLKIQGSSGMSRDKSGAAAVVGFMQIVSIIRPRNIHVIAALALVRNAIGEEAYVPDEIIRSRGGYKVRFNNTDAEGRLIMSDPLAFMKEQAVAKVLPCPHIFTIGTMTRHARLMVGDGYPIVLDNSVARRVNHASTIQYVGTEYGEPHEISILRKDDFDENRGKVMGEDLIQTSTCTHEVTMRAHQIPFAFLIQSSGMLDHDLDSCYPIKYSHFDITGSANNYPHKPATQPVIALAKVHIYGEGEP